MDERADDCDGDLGRAAMTVVAVADAIWGGHPETYHKLIVKSLLEDGHDVLSLSPRPALVEEWVRARTVGGVARARFRRFGRDVACGATGTSWRQSGHQQAVRAAGTIPGLRAGRQLARAVSAWRALGRATASRGDDPSVDVLFLPYLDGVFMHEWLCPGIVDALCPVPWTGLYMHPRHLRAPGGNPLSSSKARILAARQCHAVGVLDEGVVDELRTALGKPVFGFPDFADLEYGGPTQLAKRVREQAGKRVVIGLIGALSSKKNVRAFVDLARILDPSQYFFVLAGALIEPTFSSTDLRAIKSALGERRENLICHPARLPGEGEFNALIAACDILFAVHVDAYHSSNTLTKAAAFGRPVLVGDGFLMAERVRRYGLGRIVSAASPEAWLGPLEDLAHVCATTGWQRTTLHDEYLARHSLESLRGTLRRIVAEAETAKCDADQEPKVRAAVPIGPVAEAGDMPRDARLPRRRRESP